MSCMAEEFINGLHNTGCSNPNLILEKCGKRYTTCLKTGGEAVDPTNSLLWQLIFLRVNEAVTWVT